MLLPLATSTWDEKETEAIEKVMASGIYSMGQHVAQFEENFSEFVGQKYAVMVNSGSSANLLAVAALFYIKENALEKGDEVIVPAVSWSTTYYPLQQYGLKLKFVDVDLETLNMDLDALDEAITSKTRLIFGVNLLGNSIDYNRVESIISGKDILLIEDNCESLGAKFDGRYAGTFGAMGTYSTYFSHHISTMEGGVVTTNNEELYHILLSIRSHGWTRHLPADNKVCVKSEDPFEESFRFVLPGYNVRPLELSGAIGIEQLAKLPGLVAGRRSNAVIFNELFSGIDGLNIQKETGESSWFGFSMVFDGGSQVRTRISNALVKEGVDCRPIVAGNFAKNDVMKYFDFEIFGDLKNSNLIDSSGMFFGNHHYNIEGPLAKVRDIVLANM